jgi:glycosyltransferase involved in cell wall biosynthesis
VERHVEEIGTRLAARGHQVRVYTRPSYGGGSGNYRGMELVRLPSIATKHLDAISHCLLSAVHCLGWADLVHLHGIGPALALPLPALLDYQRGKWGSGAKRALQWGERVGLRWADGVTAVSRDLCVLLASRYHREVTYVPNGVEDFEAPAADLVRSEFRLNPGEYFFFAARLVPEKGADLLLDAYRRLPGDRPLVLAGGSSYSKDYVDQLKARGAGDPRVRFLDYVHGEPLRALYAHSLAFVLPSRVEGLSLGLLEAMQAGALVIASDVPANLEVVGADPARRCALTFRAGDALDLERALREALALDSAQRSSFIERARRWVRERYDWDRVVDRLEQVYQRARAPQPRPSSPR